MRVVCQAAAALVAVSLLGSFEMKGQGVAGLSVSSFQFVSEQRWSRTESYITYRADLVNTGPARGATTAVVSSSIPGIQTVPGQTNLHFPPVPANGRVTSIDTFTLFVDRSVPFSFSNLQWSLLAPVANAGSNQTASVGSTVTLNGSASTNPSGVGQLNYTWAFSSRPPGTAARMNNAGSVIANFVVDIPGDYVVKLTVNNGAGSDTAFITISTNNSLPVANAGPNQTVALNSLVTLNANGSSDVDGDPLTYSWTLISLPQSSNATLTNPTIVNPTFIADKPGTYIAQLIVNDGKGSSTPATVQITTQNTPPVANAGANQVVNLGAVVQLNGSNSTDVDGNPLTFTWSFNSVPSGSTATLNSAAAVNPTFTADRPGTYVVQLVVNDGVLNSAPSTVTITTNSVQAPTANAGPNQTVQHGATVTLSGSGTDPQSLPLTRQWSLTTKPASSTAVLSSTTIANPTFVADRPGTYIAQLIVNNGFVNSAPSTVTITTTNTAPVAVAGAAQSVAVGVTVSLDGGGSSDADGDALSYAWSLTTRPNGSSAILSAANSKTPTFNADVAGTYVAQLIVNDGFTFSPPSTVTITANSMNISLTPNPLNLGVSSSGTLTVTLGSPAGGSGVVVSLASNATGVATVPPNVTVPANSTTATVTVNSLGTGAALILATASGYSNGSATVNVAVSSITLSVDSANLGLTKTMNGTITLSQAAPPGGLNVGLTSAPGGIVTVSSTVNIASGTTGTFTITGTGVGAATITASAANYTSGTASVNVGKLGAIQLAAGVTVGPGQTVDIPVSLVTAAPVGGATITLQSSDPAKATVTQSVFIQAGSTTPATQPQVTGVTLGTLTITAAAPGFDGDSKSVAVTANLAFSPATLTLGTSSNGNLNLTLNAPAPPGLIINLLSDNPSVAGVPATVSFPVNATSVSVPVTGGSQGSTLIHASSLPNLADTTATVNVVILGSINAPASPTVALGQQVSYPVSLSTAAPAGGTTITLVSSDTTSLTISPSTVVVAAGQTTPGTQPQITGKSVGTANISATAPAYNSALRSATINASLSFSPLTATVNGGATQDVILNLSATTTNPLTVNLSSDSTSTATVPATVVIPANSSSATVTITGVAAGATIIHASAANVTAGALSVTVQGSGAISIPANLSVPLGSTVPFAVSLPAAPAAPVTVSLGSSDIGKVSISPSSVTIQAGQTTPPSQPQVTGVGLGTANITASAPNYTSAVQAVKTTATVSFSNQNITISGLTTQTVTLNISNSSPTPVVVNLSSDNDAIATIPQTVTIPANSIGVAFQVTAHALGSTVLHASSLPNIPDATANVTVQTAGTVGLPATTGVALGQSTQLSVSLSAAPTSPVTINLSSSDSGTASISPSTVTIQAGSTTPTTQPQVTGTGVGSATITASASGYTSGTGTVNVTASLTFSPSTVNLPLAGTQNVALNLSAVTQKALTLSVSSDNTSIATVPTTVTIPVGSNTVNVLVSAAGPGTTTIRATGPAGVTGATASVSVGSDIILPSGLSVGPGSQIPFPVNLATAAGPSGLFVTLQVSPTSKATLTSTLLNFPAGSKVPLSQPNLNGVDFGTVTITATAPSYSPSTTTVQIGGSLSFNQNPITLLPSSSTIIGVALSTSAPAGGLVVNLSSSDTNVATVPATMTIPGGQNSILFRMNSLSAGTAVLTATADNPAVQSATANVVVGNAGAILLPASTSIGIGPGVQISYPVTLSSPAPGAGVTVTLVASTGNVSFAPVTCTNGTPCPNMPPGFNQTTVFIPGGAVVPQTQPTMTGLSAGTLTVAASAPGYTSTSGPVTVNASFAFTPQNLSINGTSVGTLFLALSGPAAVPIPVTVTSSNPGVATVSQNFQFFWDGSSPTTLNIAITGVASGTTVITASSPNMANATANVTVVGPLAITTSSLPGGVRGASYTATVIAGGGSTPYAWSATGLPAGLGINASSGVISGTPSATGTSTAAITVTDNSSQTVTVNLSISIVEPLSITTPSLPAGVTGVAYSTTMAATGGTPGYSWAATGLPASLSMSPAGVISGNPSAAGTSPVAITVTDTLNRTATVTLNLTITGPLAISTTTLPGGSVGTAYSATVSAGGGTGPYTWAATNLPASLSINASTGEITGVPSAAGTTTAAITATDSALPSHASVTKNLSITIVNGVSITTASLPGGVVNTAYNLTLAATGGTSPYTWSVTGLPAPLTFTSAGLISGTPSGPSSGPVTITATDSTNPTHLTATVTLTLTILAPVSITTASLPGGSVGAAYSLTLGATGGTSPYTWSATGLPAPLTLNASTGIISGTPAAASSGPVTITATDSTNPSHLTATVTLTLTIVNGVSISTASLPAGVVGTAYSLNLAASGGNSPYTWSVTGLPAPLTFSAGGVISGTPSATSSGPVTVTVTDSTSPTHLTASTTLTLKVVNPLSITTASLPGGVLGVAYSQSVAATGGTSPYTWGATGLPAGLGINATTGEISGSPSSAGTSTATITATDSTNPSLTATKSLSITIVTAVSITTTTLPGGVVGIAYSAGVAATGGTSPYTWSATGLPANLSINPTSGVISGAPTSPGTANATITVTDSSNPQLTVTKNLSITIQGALSITTSSLPNGTQNVAYSAQMNATGGNLPHTWTATGLPAGLSIHPTSGVISGTPTVSATITPAITVTDSTSPVPVTATANLSITIAPPPPASISITAGNGQSTQTGTQFPSQLQTTVRDVNGNPVIGALVTYDAPASGASLVFGNGSSNTITISTNSLGQATTPLVTANGTVGSYTVSATVGGLAPVNFSMQNTGIGPSGTISVSSINLGKDLQSQVTVTISPAAGVGGVTVNLTSGTPANALLGSSSVAGLTSVNLLIPENGTTATVFVQGLASSGTSVLTGTNANYQTGTGTVTLTPSGFVLAGPNDIGASFQTYPSVQTPMTVFSARLTPAGAYAEKQNLRNSIPAPVVVGVSSTAGGSVSPGSLTFNGGDGSGNINFTATGTGNVTVTAAMPAGFTALTDSKNTVTANVLASGLSPDNATVGQNLQTTAKVTLNGTAGGIIPLTISSNDSTKLKFSATQTGAGSPSITINLQPGAHVSPDFYVQGFGNSGNVTYTAQATGFGTATGTVTLAPGGIVLANSFGGAPNPILTTPVPSTPPAVNVYSGMLDASGNLLAFQQVAGGLTATVNVTSSNGTAGALNPGSVTISGGSLQTSTTFIPNSALLVTTTTTLSVSVPVSPVGFATPSGAFSSVGVTVTVPGISVTDGLDIGKDLQAQGSFVLGQAAPSGLTVRVTSNNPGLMLVSSTASGAGASFVDIPVTAGATSGTFFLQALGNSGPATYTVSAPNYRTGTGTMNLTPSGVVMSFSFDLPFGSVAAGNTTTVSVSMAQLDSGNAYVQRQALRGGLSLSVATTSNNAAAATIDTPVVITGGVDPNVTPITTIVHGVAAGPANLSVVQPSGFVPASNSIFLGRPTSTIQLTVN